MSSPDVGSRDGRLSGLWFNPIADFLGEAYLRAAFTRGTDQEVSFLVEALGLRPGDLVLDAGSGPGRHAVALARRGVKVHALDASPTFCRLAAEAARAEGLPVAVVCQDVRTLAVTDTYDAVLCLCQGGFGLLGGADDEAVLERLAAALRPGGRLALTACSVAFAVRDLGPDERFDVATGVLEEATELRDAQGRRRPARLRTTCFTPRELGLLAGACGLEVVGVHGVRPGRYRRVRPTLADPELLLLARRWPDR